MLSRSMEGNLLENSEFTVLKKPNSLKISGVEQKRPHKRKGIRVEEQSLMESCIWSHHINVGFYKENLTRLMLKDDA